MIEIEFTDPKFSTCECCDGQMTNLTRFVYKDGNGYSIYHATFSANHRESGVLLAIGMDDDWEHPKGSANRVAFACRLWITDDKFRVTLTEKEDSLWKNSKVLGRMLDRKEARSDH